MSELTNLRQRERVEDEFRKDSSAHWRNLSKPTNGTVSSYWFCIGMFFGLGHRLLVHHPFRLFRKSNVCIVGPRNCLASPRLHWTNEIPWSPTGNASFAEIFRMHRRFSRRAKLLSTNDHRRRSYLDLCEIFFASFRIDRQLLNVEISGIVVLRNL